MTETLLVRTKRRLARLASRVDGCLAAPRAGRDDGQNDCSHRELRYAQIISGGEHAHGVDRRQMHGDGECEYCRRYHERLLQRGTVLDEVIADAAADRLEYPAPRFLDALDATLASGGTLTTREALLRAELLWAAARYTAALLQWHAIEDDVAACETVRERWAARDPAFLRKRLAQERAAAARDAEEGDAVRLEVRPFPRQRGMPGVHAWWRPRGDAVRHYAGVQQIREGILREDDVLLDHDLDPATLARLRAGLAQLPTVTHAWVARRYRAATPSSRLLVFWLRTRRTESGGDVRALAADAINEVAPDLLDDFCTFDANSPLAAGLRKRLRALERVRHARVR